MTTTQPTAEQLRMARKCAVKASKASGSNLSARLEAAYLRGDFDGSFEVQSALLAIQATEARMAAAVDVLDEIAAQKLRVETLDYNPDEADWEGGFEECVKRARQALATIRSQSNG